MPPEPPAARVVLRPVATPLPLGFLARDVGSATGMGVLAGTWGTIGLTTLTSPPGATSKGLGVFLLTAGLCMFVPAAAASAKLAAAAVMGLAGLRFLVTGAYELSASAAWKATAGWVGLLLGLVAVYSALGLALEAARGRAVLPLGRRQPVSGEPGVRPAL